MALPESMTIKDLSGKFTMNKQLSPPEPIDKMLVHQGIGWLKRKAVAMGTITLTVKHFTDDNNVEHINIDNHITGGIPGTKEERPLDGVERPRSDPHFGPQLVNTKRLAPGSTEGLTEFQAAEWTQDTLDAGLITTQIKSDATKSGSAWAENHVWGVSILNGERRYTRRIDFEGPKKERVEVVMYFDYLGA